MTLKLKIFITLLSLISFTLFGAGVSTGTSTTIGASTTDINGVKTTTNIGTGVSFTEIIDGNNKSNRSEEYDFTDTTVANINGKTVNTYSVVSSFDGSGVINSSLSTRTGEIKNSNTILTKFTSSITGIYEANDYNGTTYKNDSGTFTVSIVNDYDTFDALVTNYSTTYTSTEFDH